LVVKIIILHASTMRADTGAGEENTACCASCGIAEVDDIKLKDCNDCKSVRYCSDTCQREHRPNHVQDVRNGLLSYEMRFYSLSLKAVISRTVQFVVCHYRLIFKNLL